MAEQKQELGYSFPWLTFGNIQLLEFEECTDYPQGFASASAVVNVNEDGEPLIGCKYKLLMPLAVQPAHGNNYYFLAEQTIMSNPAVRRLVTLAVNEQNGNYKLVKNSVKVVLG